MNGKAPASHTHAWSTITGKPSTFPPSSHSHSNYKLSSEITRGTLTLNQYIDSSHIAGSKSVGTQFNQCVCSVVVIENTGTPHDQVTNLYVTQISNGTLRVTAKGSGFVNGHQLLVGYIIVK